MARPRRRVLTPRSRERSCRHRLLRTCRRSRSPRRRIDERRGRARQHSAPLVLVGGPSTSCETAAATRRAGRPSRAPVEREGEPLGAVVRGAIARNCLRISSTKVDSVDSRRRGARRRGCRVDGRYEAPQRRTAARRMYASTAPWFCTWVAPLVARRRVALAARLSHFCEDRFDSPPRDRAHSRIDVAGRRTSSASNQGRGRTTPSVTVQPRRLRRGRWSETLRPERRGTGVHRAMCRTWPRAALPSHALLPTPCWLDKRGTRRERRSAMGRAARGGERRACPGSAA